MKLTNIDQDWPEDDLETVGACPFCRAATRAPAYLAVRDWCFGAAPGRWDYWDCGACGTLYLDPRPTQASIGKAYAGYYTHGGNSGLASARDNAKSWVRHLCYHRWHGLNLEPRLPWPEWLPLPAVLARHVARAPFSLIALNELPRGTLIDVGCGGGMMLDMAHQLGWETVGIEIDPQAAARASNGRHLIVQGDYRELENFRGQADAIICHHVLEHVHAPLDLLRHLGDALRPGGRVFLVLPNAGSAVRRVFAENWRGLEAPRHLAIPSHAGLLSVLESTGLACERSHATGFETAQASAAIARQRGISSAEIKRMLRALRGYEASLSVENADFIGMVLRKI